MYELESCTLVHYLLNSLSTLLETTEKTIETRGIKGLGQYFSKTLYNERTNKYYRFSFKELTVVTKKIIMERLLYAKYLYYFSN